MSSRQFPATFPIEGLHYIFECMTEKDQLNFALTCSWVYRVFRIYHVGYALPRWVPINITRDAENSTEIDTISQEYIQNEPPVANYRDCVLLDGKLYLTIFEKESPICWILDFNENPLNWKKVKVKFVEFESEEEEDKKLEIDNPSNNYKPLRSIATAATSKMIYLFGGECLITGEPNGTLYELDPINMIVKEVMGQSGDLPSARKMNSLNNIGNQCLALFGGRCLMSDSDHPREYDTKEFHIYDISTKIWTIYRDPSDHVPYARSFHSTTVIDYLLYIYGGQQITLSMPDSQIHDDDDLWCFTFNSPQQEDSADEEQNTPDSASSRSSNRSRISLSFQQEKWQKLFSPRNFTSPAFSSGIGGEWHTTTGNNVGRRCHSAMFNVGKRVAILGGYERDNWKWNLKANSAVSLQLFEKEKSRGLNNECSNEHSDRKYEKSDELQEFIPNPWELCKLYLPDKKRWDQVRIVGFPEMECIAINKDHTTDVFVMGRKKGDTEEQGITIGWIRESSNI